MTVSIDTQLRNLQYKSQYFNNMLAKQKIHMNYLQPTYPTSDAKTSPLALLAATCSSIGKSDNKTIKPKAVENPVKNSAASFNTRPTSSLPPPKSPLKNFKLLSSSFKPYKSESNIERKLPANIQAGDSALFLSRHPKDKYRKYIHKSYQPLDAHVNCQCCAPVRPHSDPLPNRKPCMCLLCVEPTHNAYSAYKSTSLKSSSSCRDPNCKSCFVPNPIKNFLHPALVHQCTAHPLKGAEQLKPLFQTFHPNLTPYICNWVSEGQHCGSSFASSEALFQHLRTHTSYQQHHHTCDDYLKHIPTESCTFHRCICKKTDKTSNNGQRCDYISRNSLRFSPYSRIGYLPPSYPH